MAQHEYVREGKFVLSCDVGTNSVRTALISLENGSVKENSLITEFQINIWSYHTKSSRNLDLSDEVFMEQSSMNIWNQICESSKKSMMASGTSADQVVGLCFDATCSLVVWDVDLNKPVSVVLPEDCDGENLDERNVILWADHRSKHFAAQINDTKFEKVLKYVGGKVSPEMELPKIKFLLQNGVVNLKENKGIRFFDLADWLTYMCTGNSEYRSQCTTTCKWCYVYDQTGSDSDIVSGGWNVKFLENINLEEILKPINRIGSTICKIGSSIQFKITESASLQLGLSNSVSVAIPVIDAHSGGIGMVGAVLNMDEKHTKNDITKTLVLIVGTSSCHMIVSEQPVFIDNIWGPFYNSMTLDMHLSEGGQTYCGALLDYVVESHPQYFSLIRSISEKSDLDDISTTISELKRKAIKKLESLLSRMKEQRQLKHIDQLTSDIHISPHFNGCRSPLADPDFKGVISGLSVIPLNTNKKIENLLKHSQPLVQEECDDNYEQLAILYLSTIQALAYGTKHIIQEMIKKGHILDRIFMCGGLANNELFVKQHSNITGKPIYRMNEDSMLLGCGVLSSVACGAYSDMYQAMNSMCHLSRARDVLPEDDLQQYHQKKFNVYLEIIKDFIKYREMMQ